MTRKIGIQGIKGSFHHQVASEYYDGIFSLVECSTFDALAQAVLAGDCDQAVMAIENSIAGSILPNYALLDQYELVIVGEFYLSIQHNLMGLSGQSVTDIEEVHSHPMALLQCKKFFRDYPLIKLVESHDTAEEAMKISEKNIQSRGAIAGVRAAEIYGLSIISESIQTIKNNVTRFVIVQKAIPEQQDKISKAAWKLVLDHKRGSLATALNVMSDCNLNLTKIQSLPVIETPGKYAFFVDVTFDEAINYFKAKSLLKIMATSLKVLGEYESDQS
jgi:prephenate dehydratase